MSKKVRYEVYEDGRIYDKVEDKFVKKIKGKSFGSIISNKFKQWFGGSDKRQMSLTKKLKPKHVRLIMKQMVLMR